MNHNQKGFTLVEILIVVIILGILAAVVIPQFTQASNEARESALVTDLQTLRAQIELYKVQHLDRTPDLDNAGLLDAVPANMVSRLTGKTDNTGALNPAGLFGPYLQKFPTNAFAPTAVANTLLFGVVAAPGDDSSGWYWNTDTKQIYANDTQGHDTL